MLSLSQPVLPGGTNLSGGQRQVVALARALVTGCPVLLLDEPVAGMGPEEREQMIETVHALWKKGGLTVVLIEHDMDIALAMADRVTVMHQGAVILDGTANDAREDQRVKEVYFGQI